MRTRLPDLTRLAAVAALTFAAVVVALLLLSDAGKQASPGPGSVALPSSASAGDRVRAAAAAARANPRSATAYVALAGAHLQFARETGDPGAYDRADAALRRALALKPGDAAALTERGVLKLARHDFRGALVDGRAARAAAPEANKPFGVVVDALVELGRFRQATSTLQTMVDRKPNLDSYSRVAYLRELRGELRGAESALRLAASAGGAVPENTAFVHALLGDLDFARGRLAPAARWYRSALRLFPRHAPSQYGLARVEAAQGRLDPAIRRLRALIRRLPLPAYTVTLGEAELAAGRPAAARRDLALVRAQQRLLRASGVSTDVELALFEADHGSPRRGVVLGRRAWRLAPGVRSADALGWALTRAGDARAGLRMARRALALGWRDPFVVYHAGVAASRAGDRALARTLLRRVVEQTPRFSPLHGPRAQRELRRVS